VSLKNQRELANSKIKLARLEKRYQSLSTESGGDEELREMSLESLQRTINQFTEEIARYEAHQPAPR
jgi:hypothetical protein